MFKDNPYVQISDVELALPFDVLHAKLKAKAQADKETTEDTAPAVTREQWLESFTTLLRPRLAGLGYTLPEAIRTSVGWPSKGGTSRTRKKLYETWPWETSKDGCVEVFVSPLLNESVDVLTVLIAGLGYACVGCNDKEAFKRYMKDLGLSGKPGEPVCGDELRFFLEKKLEDLGPYPGAAIDPEAIMKDEAEKKPGSRLLKVVCQAAECGCTIRMAKSWCLKGLPTCFCGAPMVGPDFDANGEEILA